MAEVTVYLFRSAGFAPAGDTVVCAALQEVVLGAFGGSEEGLVAVFGGAALFKDDESGIRYLGVWGTRNAPLFQSRLKSTGLAIRIVRESVPARLSIVTRAPTRPQFDRGAKAELL